MVATSPRRSIRVCRGAGPEAAPDRVVPEEVAPHLEGTPALTAAETIDLYDRSGDRYPIGDARWRGEDGTPLMVVPLPG
jgi:hypothetical protein